MTRPAHYYDPYDRLAPVYDLMAHAMLVPFGGQRRFRRRALAPLGLRPGVTVLELGCGTGQMTRPMVRAGARVTSVDLSEPMLRRARRRAPGARFAREDILAFEPGQAFDRVLFAFVLHEMDRQVRARALARARAHLAPGGRLGVLDFCRCAPPPVDRVFRAYLRLAEPEVALDLLDGGLDRELEEAGFALHTRRTLALGTACMTVAEPA